MKIKPIFNAIVCLLLAAVMLLSCTSCGLQVKAAELSGGYSRKASESGEITEEFKAALADFSFELFHGLITRDEQNDLISPLSAVLCLAMLANGADGTTKRQMEEAFGMDIAALNRCLYAYTSSLYTSEDCKLNLADSIWFRDDEGFHVNEEFLQVNADWYDAQIYAAPFDDSTIKDINAWCRHYTDGMIDRIIDRIAPNTVMYLINALVFDAKWSVKYEKNDVKEGQFTSYGGATSVVQMLASEESIYLSSDGVRGFAKNYSGDKYSLVALLPDEGTDIYDYVNSLDGEAWLSLWSGRQHASVNVRMPEFSYGAYMKLNDALKALGMTEMFDENAADFKRLGTYDGGKIYCSSVEQKVFVQVDRNGTKAAALTWATMCGKGAPQETLSVILDRPFVYAIADNTTGLPLFLGVVSAL